MFERSRKNWRKDCAGSSQKILGHRLSWLLCVQAKQTNRKAGIPQLLQELLKRQYPVRVLYTAGTGSTSTASRMWSRQEIFKYGSSGLSGFSGAERTCRNY